MCLKQRHQADFEHETAIDRNGSVSGPDAWRQFSCTPSASTTPSVRVERLWSKAARQDSVTTLQGTPSPQDKKFSWPGTLSSRSSSSASATATPATPPNSLDEYLYHPHPSLSQSRSRSRSRSPSPHSRDIPAPLGPPRSHHRRTSSIRSLPEPFAAAAQPRRASEDESLWNDVARRGSTAHVDRRVSVLEPIPEPAGEAPRWEHRERSCKVARSGSLYNWSRPWDSVGSGEGRAGKEETGERRRVVWDVEREESSGEEEGSVGREDGGCGDMGVGGVGW